MKYLRFFDQFGVQFQLYLGGKESQFKTNIGGLTTIFIYAAALLYFSFQMYNWFNYKILPLTSQSTDLRDSTTYIFSDNQLIISTEDTHNPVILNPFNKSAMILIPEIISDKQQKAKIEIINSRKVTFKNIKLTNSDDLMIVFRNCTIDDQNKYNYSCASENEINIFYQFLHQLTFKIKQHQFDVTLGQLKEFEKKYYITIDPMQSQIQSVEFTTGQTQIDIGKIYPNYEYHTYLSDSSNQIQSISENYIVKALQQKIQLIFILRLENLQHQILIQYPSIGTVLANVGSIVNLLMMEQIFIRIINSIQLEKYLVEEIIKYYYPEFKTIEIRRNLCQRYKINNKIGKQLYETKEIEKIYKTAEKIAIKKLSVLNIIYELSRIQFVLQSLQDRDMIQQARDVGIKLPTKIKYDEQLLLQIPMNTIQSKEGQQILISPQIDQIDDFQNDDQEKKKKKMQNYIQNQQNHEYKLRDSDMELFSYNQFSDHQQPVSNYQTSKLIFYQLNKINHRNVT